MSRSCFRLKNEPLEDSEENVAPPIHASAMAFRLKLIANAECSERSASEAFNTVMDNSRLDNEGVMVSNAKVRFEVCDMCQN